MDRMQPETRKKGGREKNGESSKELMWKGSFYTKGDVEMTKKSENIIRGK